MDIKRKTMAALKLCSAKPNSTREEDKKNYVYAISEKKWKTQRERFEHGIMQRVYALFPLGRIAFLFSLYY